MLPSDNIRSRSLWIRTQQLPPRGERGAAGELGIMPTVGGIGMAASCWSESHRDGACQPQCWNFCALLALATCRAHPGCCLTMPDDSRRTKPKSVQRCF